MQGNVLETYRRKEVFINSAEVVYDSVHRFCDRFLPWGFPDVFTGDRKERKGTQRDGFRCCLCCLKVFEPEGNAG